jgi:DNA replication protein DnaC
MSTIDTEHLSKRALELKLYGLLSRWDEVSDQPWVSDLIAWEEEERARRGLERRRRRARLGTFKPMADFDWSWPKEIDRDQIEDLFGLKWLEPATNTVIVGPNGIGKTMIAKNLAHQAVLAGATVRFVTASELLNSLAEQDSSSSLNRKLALYARPQLLVIDELGYLSYDTRHADLLFEVVSRRYEHKPILITTNKPFAEWGEVFPNASCVVTIIDRIVHRSEIAKIDGDSYRRKEAKEADAKRRKTRKRRRGRTSPPSQ